MLESPECAGPQDGQARSDLGGCRTVSVPKLLCRRDLLNSLRSAEAPQQEHHLRTDSDLLIVVFFIIVYFLQVGATRTILKI